MEYTTDQLKKAIAIYEGMKTNREVDTYIDIAIDCMKKELVGKDEKLWFSHRSFVESEYLKWREENKTLQDGAFNIITYLAMRGWTNNKNILRDFREAGETIVIHKHEEAEAET